MIERVKGMRDLTPEDMAKRNWVFERLRKTFESYSFREVLTPTLEFTDLFRLRSGEDVVNQLYAFRDKGGRDVSLRPDMTSSVARLFVNRFQNSPKPMKWYYIGNMFRYEEPQSGRYREFWQAGVELIGSGGVEADAEVISLFVDSYLSTGLDDFRVDVGDRVLLDEFATMLGVKDAVGLMRVIDKRDKLEMREFMEALRAFGLDDNGIESVMEVTELKGKADEVLPLTEDIFKGERAVRELSRLQDLFELLEASDVLKWVDINLGIARGFDYYTGVVFEAVAPNDLGIGSIGGGGRYDNLIQVFGGKPTPATGFAVGVERLIPILEERNLLKGSSTIPKVYVVPVGRGRSVRRMAFRIVSALRRRGIISDVELMGRRLGKALDYADRIGVPYVVIVGERDLEGGVVTIRNMESGEQVKVNLERVVEWFSSDSTP